MCSRRPALLSLSETSVWLWDPPGWGTCVRSTREVLLTTSLDLQPTTRAPPRQGAARSRRAATLAWRGLRRPPGLGIRGSGGPGESPKGGRHGGKMSGENVRRKTHLCPLKWFESAEAPLQNASPRAGRGIGSGRRGLGLQTGQMRPTLLPSPPSKMSGENPQSLFA